MTSKTQNEPTFLLVEDAFSAAIDIVNRQFGDGYSVKNPHLIAELSKTILDVNSSSQNTDDNAVSLPSNDLTELLQAYDDYERKIISYHDVMNMVRDYYYISICGVRYEDWLDGNF